MAQKRALTHSFGKLELLENSSRALWRYTPKGLKGSKGGGAVDIAPPVFEIGGRPVAAVLKEIRPASKPLKLSNGAVEHAFVGSFARRKGLRLKLVFRIVPANPVIRFRYELQSDSPVSLTKKSGRDAIEYLRCSLRGLGARKEIRLSEFDESIHSFRLVERPVAPSAFDNSLAAMGPILAASGGKRAVLAAYEHGSQAPDAFLRFEFAPDQSAALRAVKGNYPAGRTVDAARPFETLWFQFAAVAGDEDDLAAHYRRFVLRHMTLNAASREPHVYYNTWNYQERNKHWNGRAFLDSMNEERLLAEIDVAHRMGVDVFVIDTGWYQKTGDWEVHRERFSANLRAVKRKLDRCGMKLGLWFSTQAAVSSRLAERHAADIVTQGGAPVGPYGVWETEESYFMCLASPYWRGFADELIRLSREVGVTYFKWDAIGQYGCDDPGHFHGGADCSLAERADCYAFEQVRHMQKVIDRVCEACPEAIVDFDITEGGRSVGLAFLASGKYFLINNGPYFNSFDYPKDPVAWCNVFVFPGPARPRICRAPLDFDKWIPSVLFLTHYLPDDPGSSQLLNIASLVLGQNGIWGDLLGLSKEGVARFGKFLGYYKQVRGDITESSPVRSGIVGGSPEIHEKINPANGRGVVCLFAAAPGAYTYVTTRRADPKFVTHDGVRVTRLRDGRARIDFEVSGHAEARMVFFGASAKPSR